MSVVVDASVIVKWIIPEDGSGDARALMSADLAAPAIWLAETANVLWRHVLRGEIDRSRAADLLAEVSNAPIRNIEIDGLVHDALSLANELAHPIYDCLYLAAAVREVTYVVTADSRFAALVSRRADLIDRIKPLGT
ncbi:MAG TPA: type II toxin-antitoxin system VapC family toxin [Rhizomicrobium sp.]|nr:type II toxin-antitoxin system VapC family toxin [Rhizomicrobium sp.]